MLRLPPTPVVLEILIQVESVDGVVLRLFRPDNDRRDIVDDGGNPRAGESGEEEDDLAILTAYDDHKINEALRTHHLHIVKVRTLWME